jgi:hypothetical protein
MKRTGVSLLLAVLLLTIINSMVAQASVTREKYGRLYADISVIIAKVGRESLGWQDGLDPDGPSNDSGRGVSSWQDHYLFGTVDPAYISIPSMIEARLHAIQIVAGEPTYAKLYADVSVVLAAFGRRESRWVDGFDSAAPKADPGRGISSWQAHFAHASDPQKAESSPTLVRNRLATLLDELH